MSLRIKALRLAKGWTQADLAERSRMSRSQLVMIENETRPANTLRLNAIAAALGVEPPDLFDNQDAHLIGLLRDMSPEDRAALVRMAEAFASRSKAPLQS
jgi:transcriptional regulator with XRE-family HTH domain